LDVPPKDLSKDLSDYRKACIPFSRQEPCLVSGHFLEGIHFGDPRGLWRCCARNPYTPSLEQIEC